MVHQPSSDKHKELTHCVINELVDKSSVNQFMLQSFIESSKKARIIKREGVKPYLSHVVVIMLWHFINKMAD